MNAVLDTNVLVSALLTPGGHCDQVLRIVVSKAVQGYLDLRIRAEYEQVLPRPEFPFRPEAALATLAAVSSHMKLVAATPLSVRLPHPSDLPFLEVAREVGAVLVTGNLRHFPAACRAGVRVLTPAEFLDLVRRGG